MIGVRLRKDKCPRDFTWTQRAWASCPNGHVWPRSTMSVSLRRKLVRCTSPNSSKAEWHHSLEVCKNSMQGWPIGRDYPNSTMQYVGSWVLHQKPPSCWRIGQRSLLAWHAANFASEVAEFSRRTSRGPVIVGFSNSNGFGNRVGRLDRLDTTQGPIRRRGGFPMLSRNSLATTRP